MSNGVLCHRLLPFVDTVKRRLGADSENRSQVPAHNIFDLAFRSIQDAFIASSSQEAANQCLVVGNSTRKLVVDERRGDDAHVLGSRNKKTKAMRQCGANIFAIAESHSYGGTVGNRSQVFGNFRIHAREQLSSLICWYCDNDCIELLGAARAEKQPLAGLRLDCLNRRIHTLRRFGNSRNQRVGHLLHAVF